jgi:hypothetical protein
MKANIKEIHKLILALTIALFTFLVGFTATRGWDFHRKRVDQEKRLVVPVAIWESSFFRSLDEHGKGVNLSKLRASALSRNDLEVRLWYDAFPDEIYGVILRRASEKWAATFLYGTSERTFGQPFQMKETVLNVPKSGWEAAWRRLSDSGILALPSASTVGCHSMALDGVGYVVESSMNGRYRTYRYGNPQLMKCNEAQKVLNISKIMDEEFDMWKPKVSKVIVCAKPNKCLAADGEIACFVSKPCSCWLASDRRAAAEAERWVAPRYYRSGHDRHC